MTLLRMIYDIQDCFVSIAANVPEVPKSSIQNGDMLVYEGHHVVMWIGDNQIIESTLYMQNSDTR